MTTEPTPSEVHTPLPWNYCKPNAKWLIYADCAVDDGIDFFVADVRNNEGRLEEAKDNAALIVTAVNERPKLLSRIEQMRAALIEAQKAVKLLEDLTACGADDDYVEQVSRQISFALKAE